MFAVAKNNCLCTDDSVNDYAHSGTEESKNEASCRSKEIMTGGIAQRR
jgi:hypothetical protein